MWPAGGPALLADHGTLCTLLVALPLQSNAHCRSPDPPGIVMDFFLVWSLCFSVRTRMRPFSSPFRRFVERVSYHHRTARSVPDVRTRQ
eukprot:scaffold676288_cov59-Prasinocladus_malaysianus.AAC.1